jgi:hypothetical protein
VDVHDKDATPPSNLWFENDCTRIERLFASSDGLLKSVPLQMLAEDAPAQCRRSQAAT